MSMEENKINIDITNNQLCKMVGLKIDVDTERGTRIGVQNLMRLFSKYNIKATFLFALGPDNTGRAIKRIFRPGFFKKISRTSVLKIYGIKTLLNGVMWPGPHIGKRHNAIMKNILKSGHEVGVHCYDHVAWQDNLHKWSESQIREEVNKSVSQFFEVFGFRPFTMGSAGWQANAASLSAYDEHALMYASDTRGKRAFFPVDKRKRYETLQIPTTLPTLDELLGREEYPMETLIHHFEKLIQKQDLNVITLHAELEGMTYLDWFEGFIRHFQSLGVKFVPVIEICKDLLEDKDQIPHLPLVQREIDGRSGVLASHG